MPERMDGGRALAALGGIVLLVSLFLDWFKPGRDAWQAFEVLDLVLAGLALAAIAAALRLRAAAGWDHLWPWFGFAALAIVVATLINHPPAAIGRDVESGVWIALVGSGLMAAAGWMARAQVSLVVSLRQPRRPVEPDEPLEPAEPRLTDDTETMRIPRRAR